MGAWDHATPFVIRLAVGDIARARAMVIAVNHFNDLAPTGAEGAIDAALAGAITRWAAGGSLNVHFGGSQFLPASSAPLAAEAVLVIGLGEVEKFVPERLPEVGAALVEAVAAFNIRDAATIVHGGGSAQVPREQAARLFVEGVLDALDRVPGAACFRELTIVEIAAEYLDEIEKGIAAARGPQHIHVYIETPPPRPAAPAAPAVPAPAATDGALQPATFLRLGITRAGPDLKVTVIGGDAFEPAFLHPYPVDFATKLTGRLERDLLRQADADKRLAALESIGGQLYANFLEWAPFDAAKRLDTGPEGYVVLRLDRATVDLPWEMLCLGGAFLSRTRLVGRQLEIYAPGRAATPPPAHDTLDVLVIGDPLGDLPAARVEAEAVTETLRRLRGARVTPLIGDVSYADVSSRLDTRSYDVLHYAGHARFDPARQGMGGLLLKDATLTADDLSTRRFLPRLVFANACNSAQTGDGGEDDIFACGPPTLGLVTGLLQAGVRCFVGSMWPVDDAAAATFARTFYETLVQVDGDGGSLHIPVGQAVRQAREAVVTQHGEGQPAWAAYALYGSPWQAVV